MSIALQEGSSEANIETYSGPSEGEAVVDVTKVVVEGKKWRPPLLDLTRSTRAYGPLTRPQPSTDVAGNRQCTSMQTPRGLSTEQYPTQFWRMLASGIM